MRGVILAGGFGTRLRPLTLVTNKHLLPVYDKPMIYYPINTLVTAGIEDIVIVTGNEHAGDFINLLGDGKDFGVNFTYKPQRGAGGIAEALGLCRDFIGDEPMVVILGDNIFEDNIKKDADKFRKNSTFAKVFLKEVKDPERFGVAMIENNNLVGIEEKPKKPKSNFAVTGLYFYNRSVWQIIKELKPSGRGELEITSVNNYYIKEGYMDYGFINGFWSDAGSYQSLYHAASFIAKKDNLNINLTS